MCCLHCAAIPTAVDLGLPWRHIQSKHRGQSVCCQHPRFFPTSERLVVNLETEDQSSNCAWSQKNFLLGPRLCWMFANIWAFVTAFFSVPFWPHYAERLLKRNLQLVLACTYIWRQLFSTKSSQLFWIAAKKNSSKEVCIVGFVCSASSIVWLKFCLIYNSAWLIIWKKLLTVHLYGPLVLHGCIS